VSTATAKSYLQIDHSAEDEIIAIILAGAQEYVAGYCGTRFYTTGAAEVTEVLDGANAPQLWPSYCPVTSVISVQDAQNENTEYDFWFDQTRIYRNSNYNVWNFGKLRWRVRYIGGYLESEAPADIKLAVLDLAFRAYYSRGGKSQQSAKGYGYSWQDLAGSDILKRLDPYLFRRLVG